MISRKMQFHGHIITAVTTAVVSTIMFWLYPVARDYGWKGVLSYVRESDSHLLDEGDRKQILLSIATKLNEKEKMMSAMEEGLKRASVYSSQCALTRISRQVWEGNVPQSDLKKSLGSLSHDLDQLAAEIDQVLSTVEIKAMKKGLSNRVVKMMERTDVMISVYKNI